MYMYLGMYVLTSCPLVALFLLFISPSFTSFLFSIHFYSSVTSKASCVSSLELHNILYIVLNSPPLLLSPSADKYPSGKKDHSGLTSSNPLFDKGIASYYRPYNPSSDQHRSLPVESIIILTTQYLNIRLARQHTCETEKNNKTQGALGYDFQAVILASEREYLNSTLVIHSQSNPPWDSCNRTCIHLTGQSNQFMLRTDNCTPLRHHTNIVVPELKPTTPFDQHSQHGTACVVGRFQRTNHQDIGSTSAF